MTGMPVYPGDPAVSVMPSSPPGAPAVSALHLGTHTGTHVDPPAHLWPERAAVDALPLDVLCGAALVVAVDGVSVVTAKRLVALVPPGTERLLLRTHNGALWAGGGLRTDYAALDAGAARWLVAAGVRLLGIDYVSVDAADAVDLPVHHVLLGAGVIIVEGLDLQAVRPGGYELACLPLRLAGGDGAPARAVLRSAVAN